MVDATPPILDSHNQDSLEELAWAIDTARGEFTLLFARCNYRQLRQALIPRLQKLCEAKLEILELQPGDVALYSTLQQTFADTTPEAVMVVGLERLHNLEGVLSATNKVREEFRRHCPYPLVLWITDDVQGQLIEHANDFESWGSTTGFPLPPDRLRQSLEQSADRVFEQLLTDTSPLPFNRLLLNLDLGMLQRQEVGIALQDFFQQGQPPSPVFSASLAFAEGLNSHPQAALEQFQRSLDFWQSCQEPITPSPDLRAALVLYYQGRYRSSDHPDYQAVRDDTTAWQALEQSVARFQAVQRPDLVAKACGQLGKVLETLENWSALETLAQDVLPLTQAQGTELAQAQVYGWLAAVALAKDTPKAATQTLDYAQQALDRVPGDLRERGQ